MKFTIVFTTLMCVSTSRTVVADTVEDSKDKREAAVSYGAPGFSSQSYQAPTSFSQADANAISIGAGYSIGGGKASYSFGGPESSASLQIPSESLSPSGHATLQLAPITLQPNQGTFASGDLSQLMSQLSHSLNSGAITLQPSNNVAEFHQGGEGQIQGLQQLSLPQYTYGSPKFELSQHYSSGFSGGAKAQSPLAATGPVLFTPQVNQPPVSSSLTFGSAGSGQSLDAGSLSLGSSGHSFAGAGKPFSAPTHSFGGSGHSLGSSGSLTGINLGGVGPSFGSYKQLSGGYSVPSKTSFKPSTYIGTLGGESGHSVSSLSGSYGTPSFGFRGTSHGSLSSLGHGPSFGGSQGFSSGSQGFSGGAQGFSGGSSKFISPSFQSYKSDGLEGASVLSSGHFSSPPGTTYGIPSSSYSNNIHSASVSKPYYVSPKHYRTTSSFGHGSYRSPASSHGSLGSFSSGTKYSFGGPSSQFEPADAHVSASENSYNTIKYSEELKPVAN